MADKINNIGPDQFSALGMLRSLTETTPAIAAISPLTYPVTFAGSNVPQGRAIAADTELTGKFSPTSQAPAPSFVPENKPEEGMDVMTFYMLMHGQPQDLTQTSDEDFAKDFEKFINAISNVPGFENLRNQEVTFGGRTMTLGQLTSGFAEHGIGMAGFGAAHFAPGNPMSQAALGRASASASPAVRDAIEMACRMTGADRGAMFAIARQESGFNPNAHARTSSATGLYQFLDDTWATEVRRHGDLLRRAGIDPATASRTDPRANALMGAAFFVDNKASVSHTLGREANGAEVYMAHFLGAGGANKFFRALETNPNELASNIFGGAASRNNFMYGQTLSGLLHTMQLKLERT